MSYSPTWTQQDANGRVTAGVHFIRAVDAQEIADAINRRRRLVYLWGEDFSSQVGPRLPVRGATFNVEFPPPFTNFHFAIEADITNAKPGGLGGEPATPIEVKWLWPVDDGDLGKVIVNGFVGVGPGQVSLFRKLNGGTDWTDPTLWEGVTGIRAVQMNELRRALEYLHWGRWRMPIYPGGGILSAMPDWPWLPGYLFHNTDEELRCISFAVLATAESLPRGLVNVTARPESAILIRPDYACTVEVYRCKRVIDFDNDLPTWNDYAPAVPAAWQTPGGLGANDAEYIGSVACAANQWSSLSGSAVAAAAQAMIDGAPQNFLFRRGDLGDETIQLTAELSVQFDLDSPPN